jgi:hypothetical protein
METEAIMVLIAALALGGAAALAISLMVSSRRSAKHREVPDQHPVALAPSPNIPLPPEALQFASLVNDQRQHE